jgi:hypothetical protein
LLAQRKETSLWVWETWWYVKTFLLLLRTLNKASKKNKLTNTR